jgi:hypothetical protein
MNIAFVGWGSLIWNPCGLKTTGSWKTDGPLLPVEFARISKNGRLTLVLYPDAWDVQTLWVHAACSDLQEAIDNLAKREETSRNGIGFICIPDCNKRCIVVPEISSRVKMWTRQKEFDAIVWTDLPSNFEKRTKMQFNENNVVKYLLELKRRDPEAYQRSEEYIRKAPDQIETKVRQRLRQEFGWKSIATSNGSYRCH